MSSKGNTVIPKILHKEDLSLIKYDLKKKTVRQFQMLKLHPAYLYTYSIRLFIDEALQVENLNLLSVPHPS